MKRDNQIHHAIDESLDSVRFNAHDMRTVMHTVRSKNAPRRARSRKKCMRLDFIFAMGLVVLVVGPLSLFALRALRMPTSDITTIATDGMNAASSTDQTIPDPTSPPSAEKAAALPAISESEAIQAARACFEALCDTTVFTFEEYTVSVQAIFPYASTSDSADYEVTMKSIYTNGCAFTVVVDGASGEIISYSTPSLATMPTYIDNASGELQAWYDKYGEYIFTWPMDVQAEFSRRYEGAMLRMPREGDLSMEAISAKLGAHYQALIETCPEQNCTHHSVQYCAMLYSERAFADGQARYQIYCFLGDEITDTLPDVCMLLTFLASDGTLESKEILSTAGL